MVLRFFLPLLCIFEEALGSKYPDVQFEARPLGTRIVLFARFPLGCIWGPPILDTHTNTVVRGPSIPLCWTSKIGNFVGTHQSTALKGKSSDNVSKLGGLPTERLCLVLFECGWDGLFQPRAFFV